MHLVVTKYEVFRVWNYCDRRRHCRARVTVLDATNRVIPLATCNSLQKYKTGITISFDRQVCGQEYITK